MARHWQISYKWVINSMRFFPRTMVIAWPTKPTLSVAHDFAVKEYQTNVVGRTFTRETGITIPSKFVKVTETAAAVTWGNYLDCCSGQKPKPAPTPPAPPPVLPQPPNPNFWIKADAGVFSDAGTTPAVNNGPIHQWNDQSSGGHNVDIQFNNPIYQTNILNGYPIVNFGTNSFLANNALGHAQPMTLCAVISQLTSSPSAGIIFGGAGGGLVFDYFSNAPSPCLTLNAGTLLGGGTSGSNAFIYCTFVANTASSIIRMNGVQVAAGNVGNNMLAAPMEVGVGVGFNIAEIIMYESVLSGSNISAVENYLKTKYGL